MNKLTSIDLFSGCGGLSLGLDRAGIHSVLAVDNWADALQTLQYNLPGTRTLLADMSQGAAAEACIAVGETDLVVGGPPCQGFSISGKRDPLDPRNQLYQGFVQVVKTIRPVMFIMENVPNMASMNGGRLLEEVLTDFETIGYRATYKTLLASDFGVPQNRRRLIIVGTRLTKSFDFSRYLEPQLKSDKVTVREAISDLPSESVINGSHYEIPAISDYQELIREGSVGIFNHETTNHSEKTRAIVSLVPDGGNYKDLPPHLQGTRKVNIAWTRFASHKPSLTIDTGHRHHFHYEFDRIPTVRESARLQSFPDSFIFLGSKTSQYRQVGNAVPPLMAEQIGLAVKRYLEVERG